jgi:hypothetical protein
MLILIYSVALCFSAFLLFWIEPLFTKMVLPILGGSPAVWNTALMFFQLVLLLGYGYAYVLSRVTRPRWQVWIHGVVLVIGLMFLPLAIAHGWMPPSDRSPIPWLLGLLAVSIGWPFFALSASAPLLQAWFAKSGHRLGADPYFLYVASNLGSLLALMAFPFLFEPTMSLAEQNRIWMLTYFLVVALIGGCGLTLRKVNGDSLGSQHSSSTSPGSSRHWAVWIALAFVPSSLLLGVTTYITTDIASAPLLWVIPLALYLLSFIVAFSRRGAPSLAWALKGEATGLVIISMLVLLTLIFSLTVPVVMAAILHLITFFFIAIVCHTELASRRPGPDAVTKFYFAMSIGGAAGGIFNAIIAPVMFSSTYEYYLVLAVACWLRSLSIKNRDPLTYRDFVLPAALTLFVVAGADRWIDRVPPAMIYRGLFLLPVALLLYSFSQRPVRFALGVGGLFGGVLIVQSTVGVIFQERSFFGVLKVKHLDDGRRTVLVHGTTIHGAEFVDPALRREPLMYYHRAGPIGQFFGAVTGARTVGVIGLGTGALACYRTPGQEWTFYEIDQAVERVANNTSYFHYLEDCGADSQIVLGDGRLSIQARPDSYYDLIVVDAFSSDSIPLHLMTREAMLLYLRKLRAHGVILFHVSNLYLRLAPVVATVVRSVDAVARDETFQPSVDELKDGASLSEWIAIARSDADLAFLDREPRWKPLVADPHVKPWTDDFSNVVSAIVW